MICCRTKEHKSKSSLARRFLFVERVPQNSNHLLSSLGFYSDTGGDCAFPTGTICLSGWPSLQTDSKKKEETGDRVSPFRPSSSRNGGGTLCKQESYWMWESKRFTGNFYKEREISETLALDDQATFDR